MIKGQVSVHKIAITPAQVKTYNLLPNPAKETDPRSKAFIANHGISAWEVDAINPVELRRIIISEITTRVDIEAMDKVIEQENVDKARLTKAVKRSLFDKP